MTKNSYFTFNYFSLFEIQYAYETSLSRNDDPIDEIEFNS
jgi:hypothetical protein